ncbi:hypothetical protein [Micromonospora ureilytica]|uniref:Uncharacterized protein n=1 Tax=Micromonospora ureilytica TaxID=709868 RepID=A0ABS0JPC8_9ACTN|nr:hypothetical protein [Micromonospora ureilytica]MBG6068913.1 hypothetical protein [Micromonospora ureilytica]
MGVVSLSEAFPWRAPGSKLDGAANAAMIKQLGAMPLHQLADLTRWTYNPKLTSAINAAMTKQLGAMPLHQLADLTRWTYNPKLTSAINAAMTKQLGAMPLHQLADLTRWTYNPKLTSAINAAMTKQLGAMPLHQLADLTRWTYNPKLTSAINAAMTKQLGAMPLHQLADLTRWTYNPKLTSAINAAMTKQLGDANTGTLLAQIGSAGTASFEAWRGIITAAKASASRGVAEVLAKEAPSLVEDPAGWVIEAEEAAGAGNAQAGDALLLVRYLFGCFLLLTGKLNPKAKTIEKFGSLLALSTLLGVVVGTIDANSPKTLEKLTLYAGIPSAAMGLYFGMIALQQMPRPRRSKPSLNRRGNSKPRTKVLQRVHHR